MEDKGGDFFAKLVEGMKRSYITIGDFDIHTQKIFVISRSEYHNGQRMVYEVIINEERFLPTGTASWYCNLSAKFYTKEQRENEYERLRKLLKEKTMCKFLN
jgi:hypothetical protein